MQPEEPTNLGILSVHGAGESLDMIAIRSPPKKAPNKLNPSQANDHTEKDRRGPYALEARFRSHLVLALLLGHHREESLICLHPHPNRPRDPHSIQKTLLQVLH